jgi:TetR/AcrR family transcriptional regulator, transcriptional repressor for nem operon
LEQSFQMCIFVKELTQTPMPKIKQYNREKVLETASAIFRQKGYNGTSIDEILVATGLSRSSLYDTFKDKHSLYLLSLEHYKTANQNQMTALDEKPMEGIDKIKVMFNKVVDHLVQNPNDNGCLMVNAAAEMSKQCFKTQQVVCNNKDAVQDLIAEWLKESQAKNIITLKKPVKTYSEFLYNTLLGLRIMSQTGAEKQVLNNIVKIALEKLN